MANETPWFPESEPPTKVGVYEVFDAGGVEEARASDRTEPWYAYWDGEKFGYRVFDGVKSAYLTRELNTCLPRLTTWRGATHPNHPGDV